MRINTKLNDNLSHKFKLIEEENAEMKKEMKDMELYVLEIQQENKALADKLKQIKQNMKLSRTGENQNEEIRSLKEKIKTLKEALKGKMKQLLDSINRNRGRVRICGYVSDCANK